MADAGAGSRRVAAAGPGPAAAAAAAPPAAPAVNVQQLLFRPIPYGTVQGAGGEQLGSGGFGTVEITRYHGSLVAVKTIEQDGQDATPVEVGAFANEMTIHSSLLFPHIVQFLGACLDPRNLCLVMEVAPLGSLCDLLYSHLDADPGPASEAATAARQVAFAAAGVPEWVVRVQILRDVACGLEYMHTHCEHPFVHKDIKAGNVLLFEGFKAKLSDFGISTQVTRSTSSKRRRGTVAYMAPEVLLGSHIYSPKSDVYSMGVLTFEVVTGVAPFAECGYDQPGMVTIIERVTSGGRPSAQCAPQVPRHVFEVVGALSSACWAQEREQRPSARTVCAALEAVMAANRSTQSAGPGAPAQPGGELRTGHLAAVTTTIMRTMLSCAGAQAQGCHALVGLLAGGAPVSTDMGTAVIAAMAAHGGNARVQLCGATAIVVLVRHGCHTTLAGTNVCGNLLVLLRAPGTGGAALKDALAAVTALCRSGKSIAAELVAAGACTAVADVLRRFLGAVLPQPLQQRPGAVVLSPEVQAEVVAEAMCAAVGLCLAPAGLGRLTAENFGQLLLVAMNQYRVFSVQAEGLRALMRLCADDAQALQALRQAGGADVVRAALAAVGTGGGQNLNLAVQFWAQQLQHRQN